MSNFKKNNDGSIENQCHKEEGTCCANCKYGMSPLLSESQKWVPCSESCFNKNDLKEISCLSCKHRPNYMN